MKKRMLLLLALLLLSTTTALVVANGKLDLRDQDLNFCYDISKAQE